MKNSRGGLTFLAALILPLFLGSLSSISAELAQKEKKPGPPLSSSTELPQEEKTRLMEKYARLPLSLEANRGQAGRQVKFLARGRGYTLFLTSTEAVLFLQQPGRPAALRMKLAGANREPEVAGLDQLPGRSNYYFGNDPRRWHTNIPTYARVEYRNVYPGIDLVYHGNQERLEYDFVVHPGANPNAIRLAFSGADRIQLDTGGDLLLHTAGGPVRQHRPLVYQEVNGVRREIAGGYVLKEKRRVGFAVAGFDPSRPLVIDPVLSYASFLGGKSFDEGAGIAVDASGNAYVAGSVNSRDFPTLPPLLGAFGGSTDGFVLKINAAGTALVYSNSFGGVDVDRANGIAVDGAGNVYLTGSTRSPNFPLATFFQRSYGGGFTDGFLTKFDASGVIVYSTYLGGGGDDVGRAVAVDAGGNAYVTGSTTSRNFPTKNPLQAALGGFSDAFVSKFHVTGDNFYSTYLGGDSNETGWGIAADPSGNAYVTGGTTSLNFPTANAVQPKKGDNLTFFNDVFVAKLSPNGSGLVYSTYIGGNSNDEGRAIAVDASGAAYVTGLTSSTNFPLANALQLTKGDLQTFVNDAFVLKLAADGAALVYSTYLGGNSSDTGLGIAVNSAGNAYVTGSTTSTNFPTVNAVQSTKGDFGDDAFVAKLNASGSALIYSTYLGGGGSDAGTAIAVDSAGSAYVTGRTSSPEFPTGVIQAEFGGNLDAFVFKLADQAAGKPVLAPGSVVNGASFRPATDPSSAVAPGSIVAVFGSNLTGITREVQLSSSIPLSTTLLDTTVTFNNVPAPLFYVSPSQINAQVPFEAQPGTASVQVNWAGNKSDAITVSVAAVSPGIFAINEKGTGPGEIRHALDFQRITDKNPAVAGEYLAIFSTGLGKFQRPVPSGQIAPSPPPETVARPTVTIAGAPAKVIYSGPASGFVGLYQVNVLVPDGLAEGLQPVQITIEGAQSNIVTVAVGKPPAP